MAIMGNTFALKGRSRVTMRRRMDTIVRKKVNRVLPRNISSSYGRAVPVFFRNSFFNLPPVKPRTVRINSVRAMGEARRKPGPREEREMRKYLST
jgi:hypothetical protein